MGAGRLRGGLARAVLRMREVHLSAYFTLHGMERLPYPDDFFGGVLSVQVIHHNRLEAIRGTVADIDRVTRPGGLIWVTVPASKNEPSQKQEEIEPGTFVPLDGPEQGVPHHYFTEWETASLYPGCKLIDLHVDPFNHYSLLVRRPVSPPDDNASDLLVSSAGPVPPGLAHRSGGVVRTPFRGESGRAEKSGKMVAAFRQKGSLIWSAGAPAGCVIVVNGDSDVTVTAVMETRDLPWLRVRRTSSRTLWPCPGVAVVFMTTILRLRAASTRA